MAQEYASYDIQRCNSKVIAQNSRRAADYLADQHVRQTSLQSYKLASPWYKHDVKHVLGALNIKYQLTGYLSSWIIL